YYTHGSQVTVSHGHLAFFGAYALLNLTVFYFAMPGLRGVEIYQATKAKLGFWTMCSAMMLMGLTFGIAGVLQSYLERVLGMGYMTAQSYMRLWMAVTLVFGVFFLAGVLITVFDLLSPKAATAEQER
ncbi:MAG: cbb3-type cytochrome c oxidase subunit I, partial [Desulfuromonadaceae bacterium]